MKTKLALCLVLQAICAVGCVAGETPAETKKQPVFLLCPDREHYGSWSIYFVVNKKDPTKPLSLGLEELSGHNKADDGGYGKVLDAQENPSTQRVEIATLDAKQFGSGALKVEKNSALNVTITPDGDTYKLVIDLRIEQDKRFNLGGEKSGATIILKYNPAFRAWGAYATSLSDHQGKNIVAGEPVRITGLWFPVSATAISRIYAVLAGNKSVLVYDR